MSLTYHQTRLVRDTIPLLRSHGEHLTTLFYTNMLRAHPSLHNHFNLVNQANGRQPRALTSIILAFASNIANIAELIPRLERTCHKHCSLGIKPEHYDIVGKYLVEAFAEVLGPEIMTSEVKVAWTKAYGLLARMLIGREEQMYRDFGGWDGWRRFRIQRKVVECEDVVSFYLVPVDGKALPEFRPGQYVSVRVDVPRVGYLQSRQYSLSEMPRPDYYRISVKRDQGTSLDNGNTAAHGMVSNLLIDEKKAGDELELSHPAGEVFFDTSNANNVPLVLISAGIGITPMMCILNTVTERQPARPVSFIHGSTSAMPFQEHVSKLKRQNSSLKTVVIFKSKPASSDVHYDHNGRFNLSRLSSDDLFLGDNSAEYFISGPENFMVETSEYLAGKGVSSSRMRFELFSTGELETKKPAQLNGRNMVNGFTEDGALSRVNGTNGVREVNGLNGLNSHPVGYPVSRASGMSDLWKTNEIERNGTNGTSHGAGAHHNW